MQPSHLTPDTTDTHSHRDVLNHLITKHHFTKKVQRAPPTGSSQFQVSAHVARSTADAPGSRGRSRSRSYPEG